MAKTLSAQESKRVQVGGRSGKLREPIIPLKAWVVLAWLAIALAAGCVFFANLRFGPAVMGVAFQDDFYYYATVARNLALHGRSTFDGIHLTNGYHPLWLGILTLLTWINGASGSGVRLALMLECVQTTLLAATALFAYRVARRWCSLPWALTLQLLVASLSLLLLRSGMEAGLVVAAALALLDLRTSRSFSWKTNSALAYGLLASVLVLSRLDAALLVVLLLVLDVAPAMLRRQASRAALLAFCAGLVPVALYLGMNAFVFGTLLPVSGTAKQLRRHHTPSLGTLTSFGEQIFHGKSPVFGLFAVLVAIALGCLIADSVRGRRQLPRRDAGVVLAVLLFPALHMLVVACLSDWPVWDWYLYPWPVAGVVAAAVLQQRSAVRSAAIERAGNAAFAGCLLLFVLYALLLLSGTSPAQSLTYLAGEDVQRFAAGHPGLYAMGDRAGAVGYLSSQPTIQLEGLMMDRAYLQNVREGKDLRSVLRSYGVRYYISTEYPDKLTKCFRAREPVQAGPDSPAMTGVFCSKPLAIFPHGYLTNRIFDLSSPD